MNESLENKIEKSVDKKSFFRMLIKCSALSLCTFLVGKGAVDTLNEARAAIEEFYRKPIAEKSTNQSVRYRHYGYCEVFRERIKREYGNALMLYGSQACLEYWDNKRKCIYTLVFPDDNLAWQTEKALNEIPSEQRMSDIMKLDSDGDGVVTQEEFIAYVDRGDTTK